MKRPRSNRAGRFADPASSSDGCDLDNRVEVDRAWVWGWEAREGARAERPGSQSLGKEFELDSEGKGKSQSIVAS